MVLVREQSHLGRRKAGRNRLTTCRNFEDAVVQFLTKQFSLAFARPAGARLLWQIASRKLWAGTTRTAFFATPKSPLNRIPTIV
jgi:hypothetical protein